MSDPVTNLEIEDVLSSIRRLVSNGQPERQSAPRASGGLTADRLVLTPALRVDGGAVESESQRTEPPVADSDWAEVAEADAGPELAAETQKADADPQSDFKDESAPEGLEIEQFEAQAPTDTPSELSAQAAEFEAMVAGRIDQWEPDGASDDDYAGAVSVSALNWSEMDGSEKEEGMVEAEAAPSADPDWDEADDMASERHLQDWQDADEAATRSMSDAGADRGEGLLVDDAVLDEEALRDLVAEIVRQELQGALGERITRNVRKLVRREIHRALTSQDFD
ncbi:MAG: hypothetical protein ACNA7M_05995 [Roseovarius sp.]